MTTRQPRWLFSAAAAAGTLLALTGADTWGIREDEFECEEAVQRLIDCCPSDHTYGIACIYDASCSRTTRPDLDPELARCLRKSSCEQLVRSGACDRKTWMPSAVCGSEGTISSGSESGRTCNSRKAVPQCRP